MGIYRTKITDYIYKEKIAVYSSAISFNDEDSSIFGNAGTGHRQHYKDMSEEKQKKSDDRRIRYYKKKVCEIIEIAMMNQDLNVMITLTFKESITSYEMALAEWQLFLKRLRHLFPDRALKYICVWEYQKERSKKAGIEKGGIFHFHALLNTGYIEHSKLEKIWGNGFVIIKILHSRDDCKSAICYVMKYIVKDLIERIEDGKEERGKRFFFTSNNLQKPKEIVIDERLSIDDIIMENLENMIKDGSYDIKDANGKTINHVDYVEYKK